MNNNNIKTREIKIGNLKLGNGNPVLVQSMTNTDTRDREKTLEQILNLEEAGCEIIRIAIPDEEAIESIKFLKDNIHIPLVADIHFDYNLAVMALEKGADCVRINPGNLGGFANTKKVVDAAIAANAAIRVGVNSGSLEREILKESGITAESLVKSALLNVRKIYEFGFENFKVSIKASSVPMTIAAYRMFTKLDNSPLHIGITEAGTEFAGIIKSSVGIGSLLYDGIGDTLRVSLTSDPAIEVKAAWHILSSLDLRKRGATFISCPTCGRTEINLITLAKTIEKLIEKSKSNVTVAVMGCPVNGPGEAREADYGIAGGRKLGVIFKKGKVILKAKEDELLDKFISVLKDDKII